MEPGKTCSFYVKRKKRYCKMLVRAGQSYCGQHLVEEHVNGETNQLKRIPCPLDPKHSCFEHRLEQHLAICNAREKTGLSYMSRNINLRPGDQEEPPKTSLSSLSDQQLLSFITRVEAAHRENVGTIEESILSHHIMKKEMTRPGYGPSVVRHLSQNSSILGHLENSALLNTSITPTCFIEFGAGRDLALHCLSRCSRPVVAGLVLALCCHHRCTWNTYSGFTFLQDSGFCPSEFYTLTALTSWATCNSMDIPSKESLPDMLENYEKSEKMQIEEQVSKMPALTSQEGSQHLPSEDNHLMENRYTRLNLSAHYREEVGRKAKQLLDYGRVKYLQQQGFQCRLVQYVSKEKTLENIALVANFIGS
ncbi:tRNA:m(4)X modification enzyme TRM13 homolog isoform X3 [Cherax quadricarinatus]|uniref:tRNA:m(4)X modification enzyme TRM13 homolog isoform X3 n=1 Tax=Cherax quadricarinatus TaxID=27406 RepID=UPI00387E4F4B